MPALPTLLLVGVVLFVSSYIRAALGFGNALLAMPLLALLVGVQVATPLVSLSSATLALVLLVQHRQHIDLRAAWRLILASLVGIPLGALLVLHAPEALVKGLLGVLLICFSLYNLLALHLPRLDHPALAYPFGLVAGVLGGAYNTNGPPIIIYGMLARWDPDAFRGTLQSYFFPTSLLILANHALLGLWTAEVLWLYLLTLPLMALAMLAGWRTSRALPRATFERIIHGFLLLVGIGLLF